MKKLSSRSELLYFLDQLGIRPNKRLSQNFLVDGNIIDKIADQAQIAPGDTILEIGPGPGALTQELLRRGARVFAVEKDPVLGGALERLQTRDERLNVTVDDILEVDLEKLLPKDSKVKVVANLPYQLTTPILALLVPMQDLFSDVVVMVQDEVARRATASSGNRVCGSLTIFLAFYGKVDYAFKVSRNCFYPPPKVDSAILHSHLACVDPSVDTEVFFTLTRTAFQQRRKMLRSSLKELYAPEVFELACASAAISPEARPEQLALEDWLRLYEALSSSS